LGFCGGPRDACPAATSDRALWPCVALPPRAHTAGREYRLVELPNKLDVILVSDPATEIAAAAVSVSAGQLQDPTEVQGLAHFCEHMLFLGSEKFPTESDFDSFCAQSAGYSNAWTSMDRTVYHFMLAHNKLYDGLDRFSGHLCVLPCKKSRAHTKTCRLHASVHARMPLMRVWRVWRACADLMRVWRVWRACAGHSTHTRTLALTLSHRSTY